MTDNAPSASSQSASPKIAIIGGGLTGLFTAALLEHAFAQFNNAATVAQISIFEKSRSVGRLATRYRTDSETHKNWQWAFGAQFFTAKSASFNAFIQPWLHAGLLQPWCAKVVELTPTNEANEANKASTANKESHAPNIDYKEQWDEGHARYISTPKMTSLGRELADNLRHTRVHFQTHVAPLAQPSLQSLPKNSTQNPAKTQLFDDNGESLGHFDWVICTAPNPQAARLFADSGFSEQTKIMQPTMLACYTLMLGWDSVETLPLTLRRNPQLAWDVAYIQDSILDRAFIEQQKPAHDNLLPSVTIHARNDWSEQHVDDNIDGIEGIKAQLVAAAKHALNWDEATAPSQVDCHRWRYASTVLNDKKDALGVLVDKEQQWIVSGDWCGQGNIESGYQMAEQTVAVITAALNA